MRVNRPPLGPNFWLPDRDALLALNDGDIVKLIFTDDSGDCGERMWVTLTDVSTVDEWKAELNNVPFDLDAMLDDEITFHPLDIIDIY